MSCSYGISSGKSYKAAAEVLCSEGFHKGVPSTILQLPKGISSTTLLQNHTVSQENVSVDPSVLPCESERDEKWDPGAAVSLLWLVDGNTNSSQAIFPQETRNTGF